MGSTINVNFNTDLPEEDLEMIRDKIRMLLRGEAIPAAEVLGQRAKDSDKGDVGTVGKSPEAPY